MQPSGPSSKPVQFSVFFKLDAPKATTTQKNLARELWQDCVKYTPQFEDLLREFVPWLPMNPAVVEARKIDNLIFHLWIMRTAIRGRKREEAYLCHLFMASQQEARFTMPELEAIAINAEYSSAAYDEAFAECLKDDPLPITMAVLRNVAARGEELGAERPVSSQMVVCVGGYYLSWIDSFVTGDSVDIPHLRNVTANYKEDE